jgi:hypothetical protein
LFVFVFVFFCFSARYAMARQDFFAATAYVALIVASLSIGFYTGTWSTKNSPEGKKKDSNDSLDELAVDPMDEYKLACFLCILALSAHTVAGPCCENRSRNVSWQNRCTVSCRSALYLTFHLIDISGRCS